MIQVLGFKPAFFNFVVIESQLETISLAVLFFNGAARIAFASQ